MYKVNYYQPQRTVVFNPAANLRLQSFETETLATSISQIAGQKLVRAGAIICTDGKLLKRAVTLNSIATGDSLVYVNNPWAFSVGDRLKAISTVPGGDTAAQELAAINALASNPDPNAGLIGVVSAIEQSESTQTSRIEILSPVVVGNILTVNFYGVSVVYPVASVAEAINELAAEITKRLAATENYRYVNISKGSNYIELQSTQPKVMLEFVASVSQGTAGSVGAIRTTISKGLGRITLAAPVTASNIAGIKIGVIGQTPLGIFDTEFDLGEYLNGIPIEQSITPLYGGQFYSKALPYVDGQIVDKLKQAAWIPAIL